MCSWTIEKLIILYLLKKSFSSFYRDDWYIFRTILVSLCYYFFYRLLLHNSDGAIGLFSVNNAPSRLHRRGKVSNWAIFYWKCPAENAGNGISETLNWNIFWGNMPTDPPTLGHLRCYNVSSPCEYIFKISRYAPEVAILFRPRKLFHAYNRLSKPWLLLKLTQKK